MARPFDQSVIRLDHLEYVDAVCRERHLAGVCFSVLNFDVDVACGPRSKKGGWPRLRELLRVVLD